MSSSGSRLLHLAHHLVGGDLDDLGARVVVLVHAVAEAHQLEARVLVLRQVDELLRPAAVVLDRLQHGQHLFVGAAVQRAPQRADAGRDRGEQVGLRAAHLTHRRRAAVLLVIGVQDQQQVEDLHDVLVDLVRLGRNREHHVEEVRAVRQRVLRVDERLADRLLVGERGDGPHLRQQAGDGRLLLVLVLHVQRLRVEAGERQHHGRQDRHRVRGPRISVVEPLHVLVQHRVAGQGARERRQLRPCWAGGRRSAGRRPRRRSTFPPAPRSGCRGSAGCRARRPGT